MARGVRRFNPSSSRSGRAIQAWVILVSCAKNRQTITYGELGKKMFAGGKGAGVLAQTLGRIHYYCDSKNLPPLNALVVSLGKGKPGVSIPLPVKKVDAARESVYKFDWFDVWVPTEEELDAMA
jgi:hypothetical protein